MDQIYDKATDSANFKDLDVCDASSHNHKNTRYSII